jgi:hypothetical protein
MDAYPDEYTYLLIGALCEVTGQEPKAVLHNFGRYWVLDTAAQHYGQRLNASGRTFRRVPDCATELPRASLSHHAAVDPAGIRM